MRRETFGVAAEDLDLDLVDVLLQAGDNRCIAVNDAVEDGVEDRLRTLREQLGILFHAMAHGAQVGRAAVANGDDEVLADEYVDLAELDLLFLVEVSRGAQHDEERVVVAFQLRSLVGDDRVLDGELVKREFLGHGKKLGFTGSVAAQSSRTLRVPAAGTAPCPEPTPGVSMRRPSR